MKFFSVIKESKLIPSITLTYVLISAFNQELITKVKWLRIFNMLSISILLFLTIIELYISFKGLKKRFENEEFDDSF